MGKRAPVPGVIGLRGTDNRWNDSPDFGHSAVETKLVIGATTVNPFERHVLPGQSDSAPKSHLTEGLAGFFGTAGRSTDDA